MNDPLTSHAHLADYGEYDPTLLTEDDNNDPEFTEIVASMSGVLVDAVVDDKIPPEAQTRPEHTSIDWGEWRGDYEDPEYLHDIALQVHADHNPDYDDVLAPEGLTPTHYEKTPSYSGSEQPKTMTAIRKLFKDDEAYDDYVEAVSKSAGAEDLIASLRNEYELLECDHGYWTEEEYAIADKKIIDLVREARDEYDVDPLTAAIFVTEMLAGIDDDGSIV